jgi:hypothetical protein
MIADPKIIQSGAQAPSPADEQQKKQLEHGLLCMQKLIFNFAILWQCRAILAIP